MANSLPVGQRTLLQAVQLTADMGVLKESCTELEDVIAAQLERGIAVSQGERKMETSNNLGSAAAGKVQRERQRETESGKEKEREKPLAAARKALDVLLTENEDLVMQLMDAKLQELSGQQSKLASTTLWVSGDGSEQEIAAHLRSISAFFAETMRAMQGVLEPAVIDGAFFTAFSTLNNRLSAIFTAADLSYAPRRISAAAVHAVADGLDALREFADNCPVESLALLLDEAQQLVALLVQATAWVEAQSSGNGGGRPDDEGGFLEVRFSPKLRHPCHARRSVLIATVLLESLGRRQRDRLPTAVAGHNCHCAGQAQLPERPCREPPAQAGTRCGGGSAAQMRSAAGKVGERGLCVRAPTLPNGPKVDTLLAEKIYSRSTAVSSRRLHAAKRG